MATANELEALRAKIDAIDYLEVIDEVPTDPDGTWAVLDRRAGLCVCLGNDEQLDALVRNGADWYLNSEYNGMSSKKTARPG